MNYIPLTHRHVMLSAPGFMFGDEWVVKWPRESWYDLVELSRQVKNEHLNAVGLRRFIYDPEDGRKFIDNGWVYFKGTLLRKEYILDGTYDKFRIGGTTITPTLISNVRCNGIDVLFLDGGHCWPFNRGSDVFVEC